MGMDGPLAGLCVIETAGWNGVFAGRLLADAGADVVRVVPTSGDPLAIEPPFFGDSGVSIQETWYNAGKRVVSLDIDRNGRDEFLRLLAGAAILIEDWAPGEGPVSEADIEAANPSLVHVSVTPMGLDGPLARLRTNDLVANALSGSASVTGDADTPPISGYGNQACHTVGLYAAVCALAALRTARATGRFQRVDLSAHEALVTCTEQVLMQWFFPIGTWSSPIAPRQGSLHWSGAYQVYPGKTGGHIMVTAALNFFQVLLPWLREDGAAQDLTNPEKYPDLVSMIRDLPYVMKVMREWVATKDAEELFYEAQRRHQPFGVVCDVETALKSPQIQARGYLQEQRIAGFGPVRFPGRLFRTSADCGRPSPPARVRAGDVAWTPGIIATQAVAPRTDAVPLAGVRIMDFTHVLAGPFGTRILGDLGADVIKVGTAARSTGANTPEHPYFVCWNRNKRNVALDLSKPAGVEVARKLAARCDVIVENFSAGVLKRWGLDRASMAAANPGLSVIAMGGMGQEGPWKSFVTYAPTIHALVGLTAMTNPRGRRDAGYGFSLTDHLTGVAGALATLEGLEHRDRTGHGLDIDISQYELGLGLMAPALLDCLANGVNPLPVGNRHPFDSWAPHGIYRCKGDDEWVAIAVRGDGQWRGLCAVMERPELADDPRFATHSARITNQDVLDASIQDWTRAQDRYAVMARCQQAGLAAGAVQNARDLTGNDRQLAAREFFGKATAAERWGEYGVDRFPARFNGKRPAIYEGVHEPGADTFDVLTGVLGMSGDEIAALAEAGVLT